MTHQKRIVVLGARLTEHGILISNEAVLMLREMGVDIRHIGMPFAANPGDTMIHDDVRFGGKQYTSMIVDELSTYSDEQISKALNVPKEFRS